MDVFTHLGQSYVSINGKDYFLIRGYRKNWKNFIFVQVHGRTPLRKEDLPGKDWEVLTTKVGGCRVWTAYAKRYFQYDTRRENPTFAFVGASTEGSFFLALSHIARRFSVSVGEAEVQRLAGLYAEEKRRDRVFEVERDDGCSGAKMVVVSFDSFFDEERAKTIFSEVTE